MLNKINNEIDNNDLIYIYICYIKRKK